MANEAPEAIIRKIQKLLELASRTKGNEEEAAAAMAKAQEIMAQYNLDLAIVRDAVVEGGTVQAEAKRDSKKINRSAMYDWQKQLWGTLAQSNFCFHSVVTFDEPTPTKAKPWKTTRVKRHVVLGREDNVAMVQMMGEYLCDTIERLLPETDNTKRLSRECISWRAGCGQRICERLYRQRIDRENKMRSEKRGDGTPGLALRDVETAEYIANYDHLYGKGAHAAAMKRNADWEQEQKNRTPEQIAAEEAEAAEWASKQRPQRARKPPPPKYNYEAFSQGYVKGETVGLDTQVSSGTSNSPKVLA